jgi:hypothetical protein
MGWLESLMGGGSRQSYAATLPPGRYHCLIDELPLHLIPRRALAALSSREPREALFLNPNCIFSSDGLLPDAVAPQRDLLTGFALQGMIAWVRNPVSETVFPFWLGPQLGALVRGLRADEAALSILSEETRALLSEAGILSSLDRADRCRRAWGNTIEKSGALFREKGYAPLACLIPPFHVAALRRYYRHLIRTGAIRLGDGQSPRRYVAYNEPVARFFHHQIAPVLSAIAGEPLKPSYVYMASYLSGAELKKHTDREQCEFSVTLCLDFSPEPTLETPWPIRLDTPNGSVTVYQALGDGLAYRGTKLPHYRNVLGKGQTSTSIFFHYVAADFAGSLD